MDADQAMTVIKRLKNQLEAFYRVIVVFTNLLETDIDSFENIHEIEVVHIIMQTERKTVKKFLEDLDKKISKIQDKILEFNK